MGEKEEVLEHTITVRSTEEFKNRMTKMAEDCTKELSNTVRITDLVRLGLDWILAHKPDEVVKFLCEEEKIEDHM